MIDFLTRILLFIAFGNKALAVVLISSVPMIELKGGIPVGVTLGLSHSAAFGFALLGSCAVVVPLLLALRPLFTVLKKSKHVGGFFLRVENVFRAKAEKVDDNSSNNVHDAKITESGTRETKHLIGNLQGTAKRKSMGTGAREIRKSDWGKIFGIFLFVAIPAPGTGVWAGSFIAVILGLGFYKSLASIILGNLTAGLAILLLTKILGEHNLGVFLNVLFALVAVMLVWFVYKVIRQDSKREKSSPAKLPQA
jgi:uncharacterized membrane protein